VSTFFQYAVLGLGAGAIYTMLAKGLIVIYGGSGVLNFSQAAMAALSAYIYFEGRTNFGWGFLPSFVLAVFSMTVIGVAVYHGVMRPLARASTLARAIASLGVLILIQGFIALIWREVPRNVNAIFPNKVFEVENVLIPSDRLWMVGIALGLTWALSAMYRYLPIGLAIRASAENQRSAATLGWSPHVLATLTWALGGALAGVAGVIIAPITGINPEEMPLFILPVLAAALVGGFTSFWVTAAAAFAIAIVQSEFTNYVPAVGYTWGLRQTLPFLVIVVLLVVRGQGLPVRGQVIERLAELGNGIVRWRWLALISASFLAGQIFWFDIPLKDALVVTFGWSIVMLSVIVLLGYTGQLSLAQFALAGIASLFAARLVTEAKWPFELAFLVSVAVTIPIGLLFAIPALRTRGINLAVVTLGLAMGVNAMIFTNTKWVGLDGFIQVGGQTLLGIDIDPITHGTRYGIFAFAALVVAALSVASIRRGVVGRRLIAVRTNERAAAALGISVFGVKLYAFALAAAIAGLGGFVLTFRTTTVAFSDYVPFASILAAAYAVIGGVGYVLGAPFGGQFPQGSFGTWLLEHGLTWWVVLVLGLVFTLLATWSFRGFARTHAAANPRVVAGTAALAIVSAVGVRLLAETPEWWTAVIVGAAIAAVVAIHVAGARRMARKIKPLLLPAVAVSALLTLGSMLVFSSIFRRGGHAWGDARFDDPNPSWLVLIGGLTVITLIVLHPDGAISVNAEIFHLIGRRLAKLRGKDVHAAGKVAPLPDAERTPVQPTTLEVANITVRFGGVVAVNNVSMTVSPGEIVGLIGPNGAGKTTLIDAITGFVKPTHGTVLVNRQSIGSWPVFKRARTGVSRSFQQLELFESSTVRENLMVASDGYSVTPYLRDLVIPTNPPLSATAIAAVKILELEQYLDTRVSDLPYGRRRLVAIARAIAVAPSVLLLDEPAAGLSATETTELATVVRRLAQEWGFAILVIEHDMSFVMAVCDRITVLDFGRQIATGTPAEIRRNPAVIAAYLGEEGEAGHESHPGPLTPVPERGTA
jgi:sulfate-transporting ATPase